MSCRRARHATGHGSRVSFWLALAVLAGCTPPPVQRGEPPPAPPKSEAKEEMHESPVPEGPWRPHLLSRCRGEDEAPAAVERSLSAAYELFRYRAGSDAIMELEICLGRHPHDGLLQLTLGQLYVMGGQGEPELLPREGPAADVGNWPRNRARLLDRAEHLLRGAQSTRPDDGIVDFLLADIHRARGDTTAARVALEAGLGKCTLTRSLDILRRYQRLQGHAPRLLSRIAPQYPQEAVQAGISGEIIADVLINPAGRVVQVVPLSSPDARLTASASAALLQAEFDPARFGKYPLWSWLRIPTRFTLSG